MLELKTIWTERAKKSKERLEICSECEHLDKTLYTCKQCGCFMKAKTMFPSSKCPIEKWTAYKENNNDSTI